MFGYVTVNKPELKIKDFETYQSYYCGLCRSLKKYYGKTGQITLNYDMTFLSIFLTALYEPETKVEKHRCMLHPMHKHKTRSNLYSEYVASMNIALTYFKCLDDWQDDKSLRGHMGMLLYRKRFAKIEKKYERQCRAIEESLGELSRCEEKQSRNLDEVSGCFGRLMEELFVYRQDEWEPHLRRMGFFLGKFIYLLDAYEDLLEDQKKERYNPLMDLSEQQDYEETIQRILTMMMAESAREYELLPILKEKDILKNIIYSGVWTKYEYIKSQRKPKDK